MNTVQIPALDIDARLHPTGEISANGRLERRLVANLIDHMAKAGFAIAAVHDYEDETEAKDTKAAMELVFNLGNCNLHFQGKEDVHCMCLVMGNGEGIISDWFYGDDEESQAFNKALCDFLDRIESLK